MFEEITKNKKNRPEGGKMSTMSNFHIRKEYLSEDQDEDQQMVNDSWYYYFDDNVQSSPNIFISQNLIAPDHFLYTTSLKSLLPEEIRCYSQIMNVEPQQLDISFNREKYAFIKQFESQYPEDYPLHLFLSKNERSEEDNEKVMVLVKFVTDDIIFVGKIAKKNYSEAIQFTQENYRYGEDNEDSE